ncbi:polymer-forming cytoskeletal protein [Candidatus Berkelbacteria bacterium]|nr:polymer-forming cytoskeletal protein [Candidatus Berkelbacteria bacterium]MBI2588417.1 polymer-forming cytoskeletal protein [Candidatus Berkelbacteria bacterium]MBI4029839.1 polymer-forming cytoskeletal protein [Candidatus Berkelbacteria bacterium]
MLRQPILNTDSGTVVGTNVKLTGTLRDTQDITVHGQVDGEVISDKNVMISESAVVNGPIQAQAVTVAGKIKGSIQAVEKLEILPSGKVHGSLETKELIIRSGASFNGKSIMQNAQEEKDKEIRETSGKKKSSEKNLDLTALDYEVEE